MKIFKSFLAVTLVFGLLWSRSWLPEPDANADSDPTNGILLSMTSDVSSVDSGRVFTYTINFSFSGLVHSSIGSENLKLVLPLPVGVEFAGSIPLSILASDPVENGNNIEFRFKSSSDGGPAAGTSYKLQVNAKYTAHTTLDNTSTTTAAVIYGPDADGNPTDELESSNDVTVMAHADADWVLKKERISPIPDPLAGGEVQYQILFDNNKSNTDIGVLDIENVVLTDTLPDEAEFVSASPAPDSAPNPGESGIVTWKPAGTLSQDTIYYVTVRYPADIDPAIKVTNKADVTYNPLGKSLRSTGASVDHFFTTTKTDTGQGGFFKDVETRQQEISFGQDVKFYIGGFRNRSNSTLEDAVITDMTPTTYTDNTPVQFDLKEIDTATFHDASVSYAVYYTTTATPADWKYWKSVSPETSEKLAVSSLPLAGGEHVMGVQFRFASSLPVSFSQTTNFVMTYTLGSGTAISNGKMVENTARVDYLFDSVPKSAADSATVHVWENRPLVRLDKTLTTGGALVPSSASAPKYVEFDLKVSNTEYSSDIFQNPILIDILPKYSTYDSFDIKDNSTDIPTATLNSVTPTVAKDISTGKTTLKWNFSGTMQKNTAFTVRIKAKIDEYAPPGNYINQAALTTDTDPYFNDYFFDLKTDVDDLDGDGQHDDSYVADSAEYTVNRVTELGSYKRVRGELDDDWKEGAFPDGCTFGNTACDKLANTVAGGRVDYKLTVKNNSNIDVDHIVVVDTLPRIGDEGALLGSRGSQWGTVLTEPLDDTGKDYTVYYSTDAHAKIDNSSTSWSTTAPDDLTTVTALKFAFDPTFSLAPGASIPIIWSMRAPLGTTQNVIAWNSFAHQAQAKDNHDPLLPAEPPKVGVHINPPSSDKVSLGNYVWADLDKDGVQDPDEQGINGVKVELLNAADDSVFTKTFKDDGNTVQVPVTTVTGPDADGKPGYYLFPELPASDSLGAGDYKVRFTMPTVLPEDYKYGSGSDAYSNAANHFNAWTKINVGDANLDSNVGLPGGNDISPTVITGSIHLTADDISIDAGLEPPLGAIGDYVWYDKNGNGTQDASEPGIEGVTVKLFKKNDSGVWENKDTKTTDASGLYRFDGLLPGEYKVQFPTEQLYDTDSDSTNEKTLLTFKSQGNNRTKDSNAYDLASAASFGSAATEDDAKPLGFTDVIQLQLGEINLTVDAGYVLPVKLGDQVWVDANYNGVQDDPFDVVSKGVKVSLLTENGTKVKDNNGADVTVDTDLNGNYLFKDLLPRKYKVQFDLPPAYGFTRKGQGSVASDSDVNRSANNGQTLQTSGQTDTFDTVLVPGSEDLKIDAGLVKLVALGDYVWNDKNEDGIQDAGEPGVSGVKVVLSFDHDGNSSTPMTANYRSATTAADGSYKFANLYPGDYKVEFERGNGYLFTLKEQGADSGKDSNVNVPSPSNTKASTDTFTLNTLDDMTIDAGLIELASVGDKVWLDADGDNVQDAGENGVTGVQVQLLDGLGDPVTDDAYGTTITTKTTGSDGLYKFDNLPAGDYTVKFTLPTGYWFVQPDIGSNDALDSDAIKQPAPDSLIGLAETNLSTGEHDMTIDAGVHTLASLGDFVWHDLNGDGVQDEGEPGKSGIKVELLNENGSPAKDAYDILVASQTTDADGKYKFVNLSAGNYKVKFSNLPTGFKFTGKGQGTAAKDSDASPLDANLGLTDTVTLTIGQQRTDVDAGIVDRVSLGDFVWSDRDFDGIQDGGEPGVEGVTVKLYDAADLTTAIGTTATDADGKYLFANLWPGDYVVQFILPSDEYMFTHALSGPDRLIDSNADDDASGTSFGFSQPVTLVSDQDDLTIDAGLVELASLGDYVWEDGNDNGIQDALEKSFAGVTVHLLDSSGNPIMRGGAPLVATTDLNGIYNFDKLIPGDYIVQFDPPTNYIFAKKNAAGSTAANDSDADAATGRTAVVSLSPGENDVGTDAGLVKLTALGDYVWMDRNLNGIQDAGESGVAGVTVRLLDGSGSPILSGGVPITTTTDVDGQYLFEQLQPGAYRVSFDLPAGYVFTSQDAGSVDTADSDADASDGGRTDAVTLSSGDVNRTLDAGLVELASVGDKVWLDADGDNVQDSVEEGVAGVLVQLLDDAGDPVTTDAYGAAIAPVTTDATGLYKFDNLLPGNYAVKFTLPTGYWFVHPNQGGDDALDSDAIKQGNGSIGLAETTLSAGENDMTIDAGVHTLASLGDYVWHDINGDGVQDASEPGKSGVTVELLNEDGTPVHDAYGVDVDPQLTDADGKYKFINLSAGDYKVKFSDLPTGYKFTIPGRGTAATDSDASNSDSDAGLTDIVTLAIGQQRTDVDAGIVNLASLGNFVWNDRDFDGIQDGGEPGVAGVTVKLYDASDRTAALNTAVTDANGAYLFTNLWPGDYVVQFVLPSDEYMFTHALSGSDRLIDSNADDDASGNNFGFSEAVTLVSEQNDLTIDAGLVELASLGDYVWEDGNDNGIQDALEKSLAGVTVRLLDAAGNPVMKGGSPVTTTTNMLGRYSFNKLVPDDYIVQFDLPADYIFAKKNATGSTAANDSDADTTTGRSAIVSLSPGENDVDTDAGLVKLTALGDYVWMDRNLNGIQDAGETGVSGVTVRLLDGAGSPVMSNGSPVTTTTDADGKYLFEQLLPGDYRVSFDLPAGYVFTSQDAGALDHLDSDANANEGGRTAAVTLSSGDVNSTLDAGLIKLVNLGDKLWVDLGAIGQQDGESADTVAADVTVRLLLADGTPVQSGGTPVTTVTDASGHYLFTNLYPGDYKVRFDLPAGYLFTKSLVTGTGYTTDNDSNADATGTTGIIKLTAGQDDLSIDAGIVLPAAIGDYVWEDADSNGIQGPDEKGRNGLKVELLDALGNVLKTTTTADLAGKPGHYKFDGLMPDTYKIKFYIPDGQLFTTKRATPDAAQDSDAGIEGDTEAVTLAPGEYNDDIDAGFFPVPAIIPAGLGDRVWIDVNGDGLQDENETGLNGVTVELYNRVGALVATKVTANDASGQPGYYAFTGLNPEDYSVKFILPTGYQFTKSAQGADRSKDSNADLLGKTPVVSLIAGVHDKTIDAGLVPLSSIGDYVWIDANSNGKQDAGEIGLNGVEVSLFDADGNEIALQITGNDAGGKPGYYAFKDLAPGSYRLSFKLPNGYAWTATHAAGAKGDTDSDVGPDGRTGVVSLQPGASDLTVDAGLVLKKDEPQTPDGEDDGDTGTDNGDNANPGSGNPSQGGGQTGGNNSGSGNTDGDGGSEDGGIDSGSNGSASGSSGNGSASGSGQLPKTGETAPIYPYVGYGLIAASLILLGIRFRNRKPKRTL
ncbi:SdrD B-like domain-containing protein [Cohnella sp. GbtcB17]|uniref:SdrD B-like domain-containing protein n=1 Tax=Cohnella sp. GbtcB17 TaxID=2824762 RepID=UPI001C3061B9|nr:SdrD B-like domain-containing protein [Cohnella sp. GbtcB17]